MMNSRAIKIFLRLSLAMSFLSAVGDRFGFWAPAVSAWGNWDKFIEYTAVIIPWLPSSLMSAAGVIATAAEIVFALCLLVGFKTEFFAKMSGFLLLTFALAMTFSTGIKGPFDYSVFTAAAAAFALSLMKEKYWELDGLMSK
jgi:thiosulfate dehydrogenase (quinone) large subunit